MRLDSAAFRADTGVFDLLGNHVEATTCTQPRVLFRQGEFPAGLYLLLQGEAELSMNSGAGEEHLCSQVSEGSLLGLPGVVGNAPYTLTAVAQPGARIGFVSRAVFTSLMNADPALALKILRVLAAEVRTARQALQHL